MTGRVVAAICALALLVVPAADAKRKPPRLTAFVSCPQLVRYASAHAKSATPLPARTPTIAPTAAPQSSAGAEGGGSQKTVATDDVSQTNVQEAGIDEPDVVKTDGTTLFVVSGTTLYAVDARSATPTILGSVQLPGSGDELLLHDGHALVVGQQFIRPIGPLPIDGPVAAMPPARIVYQPPKTVLASVDVRDPAHMAVGQTLTVDGSPVTARADGKLARVVVNSAPRYVVQPDTIRRAAGWLPTAAVDGATPRRIVGCGDIYRPPVFSGTGMTSVLTIDIDAGPTPISSAGVMADAQTVYASAKNLYIATQRWDPASSASTTAIHRFALRPDGADYAASGSVPGSILSQWSVSEQDGVLRVASTGEHDSTVTTLNAGLQPLGSVAGLGPDERIRGVRFIGDVGYVVTFRQVDPLYTVDLSDPRAPRVAGELKLLGYSAYLHPVGDGLLLGIGQDATDEGRLLGAQASLFDVSDPAAPKLLDRRPLGANTSTAVESDHHAFTWWPAAHLALLPVRGPDFSGAIGLKVGPTAIADGGRTAAPPTASFSRSVVVGDRVLFVDPYAGVQAAALDGLGAQGWLAFPSAAPVNGPVAVAKPPSPTPVG
jgi:uncharacterized secreted protein with C-terminal beta-propeller domain